jgi:hypothetical protein
VGYRALQDGICSKGRVGTGKAATSKGKIKSPLLYREKLELNLTEKFWVSSHFRSTSLESPGPVNEQ